MCNANQMTGFYMKCNTGRNKKTDVYKQFLSRVAENTKIVQDVYTHKQLRPVLFKVMKKQSLLLTPSQFIQI